jgi:hypothetical protein
MIVALLVGYGRVDRSIHPIKLQSVIDLVGKDLF